MKSKLAPKLFLQLAVSIVVLITLIEVTLLYFSYKKRESDLNFLNHDIVERVYKNSSIKIDPPFSQAYIKKDLYKFSKNVTWLTILIIAFVSAGTLLIFQLIAGKYIAKLIYLNNNSEKNGEIRYKEEEIPNNEIGDLIKSRELLLDTIEDYQANIQQKLSEAKSRLEQSAKMNMIGELSSSIAHDINNPLTTISIHLATIEKRVNKNHIDLETLNNSISKSRLALDRIIKLVKRMNSFNRSEKREDAHLCLTQIVDNAMVLIANKVNKFKAEVVLSFPKDIPHVSGDSTSLEQVIMNLISNTCDAMENSKERKIYIKAHAAEDENVILSITDTGEGISSENIKHLFQAFFTTKKDGNGTGLGLSICRQIINDHDGILEVKSELGIGTTFSINLPKAKKQVNAA
ncbi:MAG: GHKL domain-containing protein [Bacteriovoracaceae bacterium]|jgi:signal transduction histidine kinase|nr:GHKL domain-containing protein [Bacteriovoracaceae bacterium]